MCRYGLSGPYKQHYACFDCRKAFKRQLESDLPEHARGDDEARCPECNQPMHAMGLDFKAPKKSAIKQWAKIKLLFDHGFAYHSCGCCGPGYRPETLSDAKVFIHESVSLTDAQQLLAQYAERDKT